MLPTLFMLFEKLGQFQKYYPWKNHESLHETIWMPKLSIRVYNFVLRFKSLPTTGAKHGSQSQVDAEIVLKLYKYYFTEFSLSVYYIIFVHYRLCKKLLVLGFNVDKITQKKVLFLRTNYYTFPIPHHFLWLCVACFFS